MNVVDTEIIGGAGGRAHAVGVWPAEGSPATVERRCRLAAAGLEGAGKYCKTRAARG